MYQKMQQGLDVNMLKIAISQNDQITSVGHIQSYIAFAHYSLGMNLKGVNFARAQKCCPCQTQICWCKL